jgi:hypothetical protein
MKEFKMKKMIAMVLMAVGISANLAQAESCKIETVGYTRHADGTVLGYWLRPGTVFSAGSLKIRVGEWVKDKGYELTLKAPNFQQTIFLKHTFDNHTTETVTVCGQDVVISAKNAALNADAITVDIF